jgi:uncharacterized protein YbjQ (UPF0145 family)
MGGGLPFQFTSMSLLEILGLVTALVVLASAVTTWRTNRRVKSVDVQVAEVHVMINSQRDTMMRRLDQLAAALVASGTAVPPVPPRT